MPFSFRDKERPSDKFHDKSSDEFMNGIRKQFDQDRKMFFEKTPAWETTAPTASGFARAGFFDDDNMMPSRSAAGGRQDIRSHLDDLANRHPEFADSLRGPPWANEMGARGGWGQRRGRRGSGSAGEDDAASSSAASNMSDPHQDPEQADEPGPLRGRPRNNLPQYAGMRNTVPDMAQRQQQEEEAEGGRGQRSWSAPPDNRTPQRFVSRLDINPVPAPEPVPDATATKPEESEPQPLSAPKQPNAPTAPPKPASNVRHIPIFVEGRDEPIVPKNIDANTSEPAHEQHFTSQAQHHFQPQPPSPGRPFGTQKRPFHTPQNNPPQQKQQNRSFNASPKPFQQPNMAANFPPSQAEEAPHPEPPKAVLDPISRVQAIQNEVATFRAAVDKYSGSSRKDKEYIFIDEMLTRHLLKLDDIETEGREDIRQARKTAIRCIQDCINTLEAKVPLPQETPQPMDESDMQVCVIDPASRAMEVADSASGESLAQADTQETS